VRKFFKIFLFLILGLPGKIILFLAVFDIMNIPVMEGMTWGEVDDLTRKERIQKVIEAGVDQFGGNSNTEELVELVKENKISEIRIDESVRRLLRVKFQMWLFEDPYVEVEYAVNSIGKEEFVEPVRC
jgi:beta-glucosidase